MRLSYERMTWQEAGEASGRLAILPLGATEQHGPHLPLSVDTVLAGGVAGALAEALGAVLLPALPYGEAATSEGHPGTLSLTADTMARVIADIGRGVHRIGHPALILLNGHFGNRAPAAQAAEMLAAEGIAVLCLDYPGLEDLAGAICESEAAGNHFYHADEVETSMMLALAPEVVRMERAVAEYPDFPADFGSRPMLLRELSESGTFGDPRPSTAEKGRALIDGIVAAALLEVAAFCEAHGIEAGAWQR
ncbi:creatininase family protein [Pseudoroseicyclus tamaricis]|uniref:Creatininase family protein n=1 Tax=Pseudoroseicyclus tamaricis TaxID=2705421 RepID=A0A6B2K3J6_9RHOB|nr:creatininase family protein [Pseudoroseicyclus tamaricis]NDV01156.1 creatininase family protein [Pseudoroseicyclus tamaricis]